MVRTTAKQSDSPEHGGRPAGARNLVHGLALLQRINEAGTATVSQLTDLMNLPKPTVIRLLHTLVAEGYVATALDGRSYRATEKVRALARSTGFEDALVRISRHVLHALCQQTFWPVDLLILDERQMLLALTTRHHAPLTIRDLEIKRFPVIGSASGGAYLLEASDAEREALIREGLKDDRLPTAIPRRRQSVDKWLNETRRRGYGFNEMRVTEQQTYRVVATAIDGGEGVLGCLASVYVAEAVGDRRVEDRLVPLMRKAAKEISVQCNDHG